MDELLTRGVEHLIGREQLESTLKSKRSLRLKFGVDPTRPDIHIGHAVVMRKLRQFQDLGHTVIFLIGDYTTKIGDPSGKSKTRPMLTDEEIAVNVKTYLDQAGLILDMSKAEIRYNSEWWSKYSFAQLIQLASHISVAQLIEREDFRTRLAQGQELSMHELLYPLMQAYDSIELQADVEFGGTDQLFNMMAGRDLQKKFGQAPQAVMTCELLVGLDGAKKMSKSLDNYVALTDGPLDMYGKIMSLPDNLIAPYYKLCTDVALSVIDELVKTLAAGANPRDTKASLAREIVSIYHDPDAAIKAETAWNHQFRDGGRPAEMPRYQVTDPHQPLIDLLVAAQLATSRGEARRLIEQGGVRLDDTVQTLESEPVWAPGQVLQVGKRRYLSITIK